MTRTQFASIAIAFSTLFAGQAMAADNGPVTRDQVKAELAEAVRAGNMVVGESGALYNEVFRHNYPAQTVESKSRDQVRAELADARRAGNIVPGENSRTLKEINPHHYGDQQVASKSREQVRVELAQAAANGELNRQIEA
jgi:ribosomal protein L30E